MFWAYILSCADGSYYTGHTDNLERRMAQYQAGECSGYTAARLPVECIWSQETSTRESAIGRASNKGLESKKETGHDAW
jgi:putative endonuclease